MATLTEEHKAYIVTALACFKTVRQVVADMEEFYKIEVTPQQVQFYDPTRAPLNKRLGKKWRAVFGHSRERYVSDTSSIGLAHQKYRLEIRQKMLDRELDNGGNNKGLILEIVESGAKEAGGAFTNRRELTGKGGGPIETAAITLDQWKANAEARLAQAAAAMENFDGADD